MMMIILAGGRGLRLRPHTEDKPKAMVPVNGRPIAELQVAWASKLENFERIVFACGPYWEKLKEHFGDNFEGVPVDYSVEEEPLGTGGAIRRLIDRLKIETDELLVMNGDAVTDLPLNRMIEWHRAPEMNIMATMLLVPYRSPYGVVRIDKLRMVRKFEEKPEFPDTWINGGIYLINPKRIRGFLPDKGDIERETFPKLSERGGRSGPTHTTATGALLTA